MTDPGIDRDSDRPAYKQLADILRTQIETGQLAGGDELPSKRELAERYGVSISGIVDLALAELKTAGLIVTDRGRRTRVRPVRIDTVARYTAGRANYGPHQDSNFAREHGVTFADLDLTREYTTIPAPDRIALALGIEAGAPVVRRLWTHAVEGRPRRVSWSYLDAARFGDTVLCDINEPPWPGGTIAQLASLGHRVEVRPPTEVGERLGTDEECELLGLEPGSWVKESFRIHIEQGAMFGSWRVLECAVHVYRLGEATLVFNSVEGRRWNGGD